MELIMTITMWVSIATLVIVGSSAVCAIRAYRHKEEADKFNVAYRFFRHFKNNHVKDFDEILRADKNTIGANKTKLWYKARDICKFFSFLGQSLKMKRVNLEYIQTFFHEYLFDPGNFKLFLKQVKLIYSDGKWKSSDMLLHELRENFAYLIDEIEKADPRYQKHEYKGSVRKYVNVIYKKYLFGSLIFKGSLGVKRLRRNNGT